MDVIKVSPAQLEGFAGQLKADAGELQSMLDELRSKLDAVQWTGADKEAYEMQRVAWQTASSDLSNLLDRIGATVHLAKQNYGGTEGANAKMFSN